MKEVVEILMKRDDMSREEAEEFYQEVMDEMREYIEQGDYMTAELVFEEEFGLEPDYIIDALIGGAI